MHVSHKLHRLFLPIVIIGALGIGIIDSVLTPSPVLAFEHEIFSSDRGELCVDDPREHTAYPCKNDGSGSGGNIAAVISIAICILACLYNIKGSLTTHPENKDLDGETYPNPWTLPAVLWLGMNIVLVCVLLYLIVFALQG